MMIGQNFLGLILAILLKIVSFNYKSSLMLMQLLILDNARKFYSLSGTMGFSAQLKFVNINNLSDLEYSGDVVQLSENPSRLQVFLDHLNDSMTMFRIRFAPLRCEILLQDWIDSKPNFNFTVVTHWA